MWVYQEPEIQPIEKGPITPPPSLPPVPEQEPLPAIVQSTPETTVPHSRNRSAFQNGSRVPQRAFCISSGMRASCGFLSLRSLYSGNSAGASGYSRDGHAFLLPALLARPVCCPERFTDCTAVRHRTAYDFGSPLRSVAVGVIRHRACAHLSFYHAVWRWNRAIDIPAVFRHTTSAGVVLPFYFRHPGGTGCRCTLLVWLLRAGSQRKTPCFFSWAGEESLCPCPAAIGTICTDRRSDASALRSRYLSCLFGQSAGRISVTVPCGHRRNVV